MTAQKSTDNSIIINKLATYNHIDDGSLSRITSPGF